MLFLSMFFFFKPWLKQAVRNLQQVLDLHARRSLHKHVALQVHPSHFGLSGKETV